MQTSDRACAAAHLGHVALQQRQLDVVPDISRVRRVVFEDSLEQIPV